MTHPEHLKRAARRLRADQRLTLDQLVERLHLPRTTIYSWIADLPLPTGARTGRQTAAQRRGTRAMQRKYARLRAAAYSEGEAEYAAMCFEPTFTDFVCLYIGEGYKRNRNRVSIANSDPAVMVLGTRWLRRLSIKRIDFGLQYHTDQDPESLAGFWAETLAIDPAAVRRQRKSNSGELSGRAWRSQRGVLTAGVNDTQLRARLQAWMDCLRRDWLDSTGSPHGA